MKKFRFVCPVIVRLEATLRNARRLFRRAESRRRRKIARDCMSMAIAIPGHTTPNKADGCRRPVLPCLTGRNRTATAIILAHRSAIVKQNLPEAIGTFCEQKMDTIFWRLSVALNACRDFRKNAPRRGNLLQIDEIFLFSKPTKVEGGSVRCMGCPLSDPCRCDACFCGRFFAS